MPSKSRHPEAGSLPVKPDALAEVCLDTIWEAEVYVRLNEAGRDALIKKLKVWNEISDFLKAKKSDLVGTAVQEVDNIGGRIVEISRELGGFKRRKALATLESQKPEVAPYFQRRLNAFLHEMEIETVDVDEVLAKEGFNPGAGLVLLASFAEKYGEEVT